MERNTALKLFVAVSLIGLVNGCIESFCQLQFGDDDYCCKDGNCCTLSMYQAENIVYNSLKIGIGAIIGIAVGGILLIVLCIVGCVCCCCRPGQTRAGTVVHTTTVAQPPQAMQQYPPGQQYPPQAQGYAPQVGYAPAAAQPYPTKDPNQPGYAAEPPPY